MMNTYPGQYCPEAHEKHPVLDRVTVLVSLSGLIAAAAYFILIFYFPSTVPPVL